MKIEELEEQMQEYANGEYCSQWIIYTEFWEHLPKLLSIAKKAKEYVALFDSGDIDEHRWDHRDTLNNLLKDLEGKR